MPIFSSKEYDVVVCGAGPAGLMAAYTLGKQTGSARRVLLIDKKEPWHEPIFCAEAVSTDRLSALWPIDPTWIRGSISGIYFTSPKGFKAEFYSKNCGSLLDRAKFHKALSDACENVNVECHYDALIKKIEQNPNGTWNLNIADNDNSIVISAKAIIDATGPGSKLTHEISCLDGIESGDTDLEPAIFAVAEGITHSREHIELFYGSEFPCGYGWIFPRDGKEVNIGFVLGKDVKPGVSLRKKLQDFIDNHYPEATIKNIYGGMIACGQSTKPMAIKGVFKAGDAASCVNPLSRSGIVEALLCGKIVAESVIKWLNAHNEFEKEAIEKQVLDCWMKVLGKNHLQIAQVKSSFNKISDKQFDKAAERLSKLPREKQTLLRIFFNVLWSCPSIIWKLRSFLH